jgi:penicillin G amidase
MPKVPLQQSLRISPLFFLPTYVLLIAMLMAAVAVPASQQREISSEAIILPNLRQPVEILIDCWGVPHIYARNEADLFFAQGFYIARERLFQIDLWRRRGLGRLAEVFGAAYVEQDKATRLFLYRDDIRKEWAMYSPDTEQMFQRFVSGINAYIDWLDQNPDRMPFEFKYLHYKPARWAVEDAIRIRSHGYLYNLESEVARARVACAANLKADKVRRALQPPWQTHVPEGLDPCLPKDVLKVYVLATQEVRFTPESLKARDQQPISAHRSIAAEFQGESNNWVISAQKSATGRAMLGSDPHLDYVQPSVRYLVDLNAPTLHVIGANRPESPGVFFGHNDWIAFAGTSFPIDDEDLYVYELNPANPKQYKYRGQLESFRILHEEIKVKGGEAVPVDLQFTRHGPVIFVEQERHRAFAVRTAWLEPGTAPYFPSVEHLRPQTFEEYKKSVDKWGVPPINHVYADIKGNIGWAPRGFAPARPNWDGLLPVPGDGRYEWAGRLAGDLFPTSYNPVSGYITTSNEMNLPADYPYQNHRLGFEWEAPFRHQRIDEVLSKLNRVSIEDSLRLQNDVISIPARRLLVLLQPLSSEDAKTKAALQLLRGWNDSVDADSPAALLYEVWYSRHLARAVKDAVLDKAAAAVIDLPHITALLDALEHPENRFGANPGSERDALLRRTLREAYEDAEKLAGPDPQQWKWGNLHQNLGEHPFSAIVDDKTRTTVNVGPFARGGSQFTPNLAAYRPDDFRVMLGPTVRLVIDVGNWDNSRAVNYPGQSGIPDSPHYRDLAPLWQRGEYFPLLYSRKAVENATEARIELAPKSAQQ